MQSQRRNIDNDNTTLESKQETLVTDEPSTNLVQTIGKPAELVDERRVLVAMAAKNLTPYIAGFFTSSLQMMHCHWLRSVITHTNNYYVGLGNLVGIADVEMFNLLQRAMVIDKPLLSIGALKELGFEITTDVAASLISGALYVALNQAFGRSPAEFNPLEMAAQTTVFTGLVKGGITELTSRFGLGGKGMRLSLFGNSSTEVIQSVNVTSPREDNRVGLIEGGYVPIATRATM
jgi:hypothetical protein